MGTYLLTWNPKVYRWKSLTEDARKVRSGRLVTGRWGTGVTKSIRHGDDLFLLRQGRNRKGIVARASATGNVYTDDHFNEPGKTALYIPLVFRELIDPDFNLPLPVSDLVGILTESHWNSKSSGVSIAGNAADQLKRAWNSYLRSIGFGS